MDGRQNASVVCRKLSLVWRMGTRRVANQSCCARNTALSQSEALKAALSGVQVEQRELRLLYKDRAKKHGMVMSGIDVARAP